MSAKEFVAAPVPTMDFSAAALGALNRASACGNAVARRGLEALERLARRGRWGSGFP